MDKVMKNKKVMAMMVVGLVAVFLTTSGVVAQSPTNVGDSPVESKINYQGQLTDSGGNPLNGTYDIWFAFYDAVSGGSQVGSPIVTNDVEVTNGLFNVKLDVNQSDFNGQGLWLQIMVRPSGGTWDDWMEPRQEILPVPYALSLRPGAFINGEVDDSPILEIYNYGSHGSGLQARSEDAYGVLGLSVNSIGVFGKSDTGWAGVRGWNNGNGVGVSAYSASGAAISAEGTGIIESTADSYIFIPGANFVQWMNYDTIDWWYEDNGSVRIWRGDSAADEWINLPITVPGVLYGQEVTVEELTIYYVCSDGTKNYINSTHMWKQTDADSSVNVVSDETDRTSNTATSYTLSASAWGNNVLSSNEGILSIGLLLHFEDNTNYIQIGGARLRLSHADYSSTCECTVDLLTPSAGEEIAGGSAYGINWISEGVCIDHVKLSYRVEGGSWQVIVANLANTGSYYWMVPVYYDDTSCYLQINIYDSANSILCSDTHDFTIAGS